MPTPNSTLDHILTIQLNIAWAGESGGDPERLNWWRCDLSAPDSGGDFLARLLPETWTWAALIAIHNASFERRVLGGLGIEIVGVIDTLKVSRGERGRKIPGGHSLAAVTERELGLLVDKTEQTSNWKRRPLSRSQERYAALDVEVLMLLAGVFGEGLGTYEEAPRLI